MAAISWWERKKRSRTAATYSRHSAEGRQENSVEIQQDQIRDFAEKNDIEIVAEFMDPGKSGLNAKGRKGFLDLLEYVKKNRVDYILCLDITRWGRFQNIDHSAAYEAQCAECGVKVVYVSHGDIKERGDDYIGINDDNMFLGLQKSIERTMAGKTSADLSKKVWAGAAKVSEQGNRAGGPPPYGMLRIEINEQKEPIGIMKPKQHKSYPNNRVRLVPDQGYKSEIVREIFDLFVTHNYPESQIASILIERNIPSPRGGKWSKETIRHILQDEQYMGSVVYNKTSSKLKSKQVSNPREKWIIKPDSYQKVVEVEVFNAAQAVFHLRKKRLSREEIQENISFAFRKYNMVSYSLLRSLPGMPTRREIINEFGSLPESFQSLFPDVLEKTRNEVKQIIELKANNVLEHDDFLVINQMFSIKVEPALPFPRGYGHQWYFRPDRRPNVDITLGVPLRDFTGSQILGYFSFPRVLVNEPLICITDSSTFKIGWYGYSDLSFIFDLIAWTNIKSKEIIK